MREAVIQAVRYVVVHDEWYMVRESGAKLNLLQKASSVSDGIQFNGSAPVGPAVSRGGYRDYFLQNATSPAGPLIWITAENVDPIIRNLMADCEGLLETIAGRKVNMKQITVLVRAYNLCEKIN